LPTASYKIPTCATEVVDKRGRRSKSEKKETRSVRTSPTYPDSI